MIIQASIRILYMLFLRQELLLSNVYMVNGKLYWTSPPVGRFDNTIFGKQFNMEAGNGMYLYNVWSVLSWHGVIMRYDEEYHILELIEELEKWMGAFV